ncbi:Hypothetical protein R9X50_00055700 [Acrodontium crateriforme]|uniref:Ribosomal RNA-processing protein 43 n=1 Tax=Acrodontium crateriforme TaxID=150365 RepID=A0AAQ3LXG6_9PEZI|nr:Hypothetical protein R9X50_00055700 [Acrodontium crateriforme]
MSNGVLTAPGLAFPRETFAKLTPGPFLHTHLKQTKPLRPNGRTPEEFRQPIVNTGSLSHSNGSTVVRVGDTAVVCGVRAEVLLASDIPNPPRDGMQDEELIEELGLLVPNLELSTGCSPANLPGNPPGTVAQSLSYRLLTLLHDSHIINPADLRIQYTEPPTEDDETGYAPRIVTKAYWTLYLDILCIAHDGNLFDAAWAAVMAALRNTVLPKAWWDPDREMIICSPLVSEATTLQLHSLPIASTFACFSTSSHLKQRKEAESWILADPDSFEEEICNDALTIVLARHQNAQTRILRLSKTDGSQVNAEAVQGCVALAEQKRAVWESILTGG